MSYWYQYKMEYLVPNEFFQTYPQWHTLSPDGPDFDNLSDDAGDPVITYEVRLRYPVTDFWFKIRANGGAIDIGEKFHLNFSRNSSLKEVYIQLDFTEAGAVYRVIEFTFPYAGKGWKSHKMCAATYNGDYASATYDKTPPYQEEVEREGVEQPQWYWFLHMSGALGYVHTPLEAFQFITGRKLFPSINDALSRTK